jgi:hypothetical protein
MLRGELPGRLRRAREVAVVDPPADPVDDYLATAAALGAPIVAVFERALRVEPETDHLAEFTVS